MVRLDDVWNESLYIAEEYNPNSEEWRIAVEKAEQIDIQLRATMDEQQENLLDNLTAVFGSMYNIEHKEAFKFGFALAIDLITEAREI